MAWQIGRRREFNAEHRFLIEPFLRLFKVAKSKGMGVQQVVKLLAIANNDLPAIEERFKTLTNDISILQFRKTYTREKSIPIEESNSINKQTFELLSFIL
jgi:hypothetical protein